MRYLLSDVWDIYWIVGLHRGNAKKFRGYSIRTGALDVSRQDKIFLNSFHMHSSKLSQFFSYYCFVELLLNLLGATGNVLTRFPANFLTLFSAIFFQSDFLIDLLCPISFLRTSVIFCQFSTNLLLKALTNVSFFMWSCS